MPGPYDATHHVPVRNCRRAARVADLDARVRLIHGQIAKVVLLLRAVQARLNDKVRAVKCNAIIQARGDAFANVRDRHGRRIGAQHQPDIAERSLDDEALRVGGHAVSHGK